MATLDGFVPFWKEVFSKRKEMAPLETIQMKCLVFFGVKKQEEYLLNVVCFHL